MNSDHGNIDFRTLFETPSAPTAASQRKASVLIVDDNKDMAQGLAKILKFHGHEVRTVYDGPDGITAARALLPQVILLDIGLPTLDGYHVARTLRTEREFSDVMIIAISGYGHEEDRSRSREAGMNHHLVKPVDLGMLTNLLSHAH
jgi:CheY-like chemotaxis protein